MRRSFNLWGATTVPRHLGKTSRGPAFAPLAPRNLRQPRSLFSIKQRKQCGHSPSQISRS